MSARMLLAVLTVALLLAQGIGPGSAKPPELPADLKVSCEEEPATGGRPWGGGIQSAAGLSPTVSIENQPSVVQQSSESADLAGETIDVACPCFCALLRTACDGLLD